jgi:hypothetical protein
VLAFFLLFQGLDGLFSPCGQIVHTVTPFKKMGKRHDDQSVVQGAWVTPHIGESGLSKAIIPK